MQTPVRFVPTSPTSCYVTGKRGETSKSRSNNLSKFRRVFDVSKIPSESGMFLTIVLHCLLIKFAVSVSQHPILLIVSYDGFRYDYFEKGLTPNMLRIRTQGSYVDYIHNVFPTKTFPNHQTIATGLYPETHGVVSNKIYDPKFGKVVTVGRLMYNNPRIEPIWYLNEKAGGDRYSASMMWPGANYPYKGKLITYGEEFDNEYDWYKRVDKVIQWMTDLEKPANLVMLYFEEPDSSSHIYGPESNVVTNIIKKLDNVTRYLEEKLLRYNLKDRVNVIHLSDHGMSSVKTTNLINITEFIPEGSYITGGSTPVLHIFPLNGSENQIYANLKKGSQQNKHFSVYKKDELPSRWHYKKNNRIAPILVIAEEGYGFQDLQEDINRYSRKYDIHVTPSTQFGVHGYDNDVPSMRPFFMARGPRFKTNYQGAVRFRVVDLLNLFCNVLEISPTRNNGTFANVRDMLIPKRNYQVITTVLTIVGGIVLALTLVSCAVIITILAIKRQQKITTAAALNKRFQQNFHHSTIEAQHLLDAEEA